ncbi:hypothetical protein D3C85_1484980 [compost metagenome]
MPFIATGLYTGPLVAHLGDTDISWLVGLIIPAILYYPLARRGLRDIPTGLVPPTEMAAQGHR